MADPIRRLITVIFDKASAQKVEGELVRSLETAGQKGGENFIRELRGRFNSRIAALREELASGVIDQKEFRKQSELAGKAFNDGLLASIRQARAEGKLTDGEYVKLARNFKRVGDEGGTAWDKIKGSIIRAGSALALYFGARQIMAFGKSTIAAASEAEAVWTQLGGTLEGVGVNFSEVREDLEAAAMAMQDTTTFGDEDFARALQNLTLVSGDYAASLENVGLVADLAAAKNISFEAATEILGKALAGNTLSLTKMFPTLRGSADIIGDLSIMLDGQAELMRGTWAGGVKAFSEGWGNFKEEIGKAMIEAGGGASVLETLIGVVKSLTFWIADNQKGIQFWVGGGLKVAIGIITGFTRVVRVAANVVLGLGSALVAGIVRPLAWVVDGFAIATRGVEKFWDLIGNETRAGNARRNADELERFADSIRSVSDAAAAYSRQSFTDADEIIALTTNPGARAPRSTGIGGGLGGGAGTGTGGGTGTAGGGNAIEGVTVTGAAGGFAANIVGGRGGPGLDLTPRIVPPGKEVSGWQAALWSMADSGGSVAGHLEKSFGSFFSALGNGFSESEQGFHSWGDAAIGIGGSVAAGLADGLGDYARAHGALKIAESIWPINPLGLASGAAMIAGASALDAVAGRASHAGIRSPSPPAIMRETGRRSADSASRPSSDVTIYVDGIDPTNPRHQRLTRQTVDFANERFPDRKITVKPYPRSA